MQIDIRVRTRLGDVRIPSQPGLHEFPRVVRGKQPDQERQAIEVEETTDIAGVAARDSPEIGVEPGVAVAAATAQRLGVAAGTDYPLATRSNSTLSRLSHLVKRLQDRHLVQRHQAADDLRATNVQLTDAGWDVVVATAPGHLQTVRAHVIDALTPDQVTQLTAITDAILRRIDPAAAVTGHDQSGSPSDRNRTTEETSQRATREAADSAAQPSG